MILPEPIFPRPVLAALFAAAISAFAAATASAEQPRSIPREVRTPIGTAAPLVLLAKFTVSDLPKSYDFYTRVIGLKPATAPGQQTPAAPVPANPSQPAFIEIPLNYSGSLVDPFFVLVQQRGMKPARQAARMVWIGFKVADAPAAVQRVREAGFEVIREASPAAPGVMSIGIVRDPDGYTVELIQAADFPP